jgi:hypothetical protein
MNSKRDAAIVTPLQKSTHPNHLLPINDILYFVDGLTDKIKKRRRTNAAAQAKINHG